jgi:arabinan endo-1,5-alpha-L-arabinosidase
MPKAGVIDPDYFKDRGGRAYLLYRTQSTPSSIRMVELPRSGRPEGSARSTELVRRGGVIENPTMLRRGRQYVLLSSEGDFGECSYKTTFRRSAKLTDWSRAKRQVLVDTKKSGLCGPGGADVGRGASGEPVLFFHAWTCPDLGGNCPGGHNYDRTPLYNARRSLFAGVLRFTSRQSPRISSYVAPILPPPPPPSPPPTETTTPTPTDTVTPKPHRH